MDYELDDVCKNCGHKWATHGINGDHPCLHDGTDKCQCQSFELSHEKVSLDIETDPLTWGKSTLSPSMPNITSLDQCLECGHCRSKHQMSASGTCGSFSITASGAQAGYCPCMKFGNALKLSQDEWDLKFDGITLKLGAGMKVTHHPYTGIQSVTDGVNTKRIWPAKIKAKSVPSTQNFPKKSGFTLNDKGSVVVNPEWSGKFDVGDGITYAGQNYQVQAANADEIDLHASITKELMKGAFDVPTGMGKTMTIPMYTDSELAGKWLTDENPYATPPETVTGASLGLPTLANHPLWTDDSAQKVMNARFWFKKRTGVKEISVNGIRVEDLLVEYATRYTKEMEAQIDTIVEQRIQQRRQDRKSKKRPQGRKFKDENS